MRARAAAGQTEANPRSVILIWLRGGASHLESFDMKPAAPPEIRGEFQVIGETDRHGGQSIGMRLTPSNVLADFYRHLGIDPTASWRTAS